LKWFKTHVTNTLTSQTHVTNTLTPQLAPK